MSAKADKTNAKPRWWCAHGYLYGCAVDRRVLVVFNDGAWYVRSVGVVEHDMANDAMVYRCDEHVSGPHRKAEVAMRTAQRWLERAR
jgi:hypothetical protein